MEVDDVQGRTNPWKPDLHKKKKCKLDHLNNVSVACALLKNIATDIFDSGIQNAKQTATSDAERISDEVLLKSASYLSLLKGWNREASLAAITTKATTSEAREAMDKVQLDLQNLKYEKWHLQKEIDKCESFQAIYQDIELVPEEEFLANAPPELTQEKDPHEHMLQRLKYELIERKRLQQEIRSEMLSSSKLAKENRETKAVIDGLESELDALYQSVLDKQIKLQKAATPKTPPVSSDTSSLSSLNPK